MSDTDVTEAMAEIIGRARRIETRVTKMMISMGLETEARKPEWEDGVIAIPTPACSMKDILGCIPLNWPTDRMIEVKIRGVLFARLGLPTPTTEGEGG